MVKAKEDTLSAIGPVTSSTKTPHLPHEATKKKSQIPTPNILTEHASLSSLSICRNKHWRFISSFHGPWLQLPHELLESLAIGNYFSPRPHIIDAAVFFDVVRIRRLVDEATNLSVRAVNGMTSSALSTSLYAGNGQRKGGGTTKLSGERRFRMRELAVKKLSEAYHLDEIAASVATMQSASSLEEVAKMVLQRVPNEAHAKYVHFFHEKIPSRALAESTTLQPLNEILQDPPIDCAVLRTRAVTRIFKEDFIGAAKDLTEALSNFRREKPQHPVSNDSDGATSETTSSSISTWNSKHDMQKLTDEAKPTGIEAQLYFQRAGVYLSSACQSVEKALQSNPSHAKGSEQSCPAEVDSKPSGDPEAYRKVKLNAKRALRDFTAFLAKLEYSPGLVNQASPSSLSIAHGCPSSLMDSDSVESLSESGTLIPSSRSSVNGTSASERIPSIPPVRIYQVSDLFSPTPPGNLPPFPATYTNLVKRETNERSRHDRLAGVSEQSELVSYHPLLIEALHGLLLCHALLQTDKLQIQKHAYMVARLVTLSDGFPVFVAVRSASRADWVDILEQTSSWLDLGVPWDQLCKTANHGKEARMQNRRSEEACKDRHNHELVMDASADDRTQTNKALYAAANALEIHKGDENATGVVNTAKPRADLKAYLLGTERADLIARWIMNAPLLPDAPVKSRKGKKKATRASAPAID